MLKFAENISKIAASVPYLVQHTSALMQALQQKEYPGVIIDNLASCFDEFHGWVKQIDAGLDNIKKLPEQIKANEEKQLEVEVLLPEIKKGK